jgi:SAM-dependent methyltransferase
MALYALTILLGSFLLFQVQPLIGKYILPWFGGTPAVWTTCMLSFQVYLLVGYAYAHAIATWLTPRRQGILHLVLLVASVLALPIIPSDAWKPMGDELPTWRILCLLAVTIGAPYLLLASTSPLIQSWFARTYPGRSPYRLYALSNVGSLAALVTYPFVFEPTLRLGQQAWGWSVSYVVFAVLCGGCAVRAFRAGAEAPAGESPTAKVQPAARPAFVDQLLWIGLSACGSVLLLATTSQICQEVAVVPFLWVLPLSLYLITFIICFDHERWYRREIFGPLWVLAIAGACGMLIAGNELGIWLQIGVFSVTMFIGCMVCHGEMVRLKPEPRYLTQFYLLIATGGALGGVFASLVAPVAFLGYWEYHISLFAGFGLLLAAIRRSELKSPPKELHGRAKIIYKGSWGAALLILALIAGSLIAIAAKEINVAKVRSRNFYGLLRVKLHEDENGEYLSLVHGRINHGYQYIDADKRRWPTSYYGKDTGVGIAIRHHPRRNGDDSALPGMRIGVIGLGTGTLATYGKPGDHIRFYDINPDVIRLAREQFSYWDDSEAEVDVVLGDARISLERALAKGQPEGFDVLVVDAFSSDAIPLHLLTRECFEVYWKHLKPDGILAVHISNRMVNLQPVVRALAAEGGHEAVFVDTGDNDEKGVSSADWVLVTSNQEFLDDPAVREAITPWPEDSPEPFPWTDDFSNLFQVLE